MTALSRTFGMAAPNFTAYPKMPDAKALVEFGVKMEQLGFDSLWAWDHILEMAKAGLRDEYVKTQSQLTLEEREGRWDITGIKVNVVASVPEVHATKFQHVAESAKAKCPISRALKIPIKMTVKEEPEKNVVAA